MSRTKRKKKLSENKQTKTSNEKSKQVRAIHELPLLKTSSVSIQLLFIIILTILIFGAYSNSFKNEFVFDDIDIIVNNKLIRDVKNIPAIFQTGYWGKLARAGNYRPLVILSYLINYQLGGLNPAGYHFANTFLHLIVCILILFLIYQISLNWHIAGLTSIIFAVHPIHTEAVASIVGRAELLAAIFFMASLLCYIRSRGARYEVSNYIFSLIFFFLSLISKESAITLIGIIVLYDICFTLSVSYNLHLPSHAQQSPEVLKAQAIKLNQQISKSPNHQITNSQSRSFHLPHLLLFSLKKRYWGYVFVIFIYLVIRHSIFGAVFAQETLSKYDNPLAYVSFWERGLTAVKVMGYYFKLLIMPIKLSADYSYNQIPVAHSILEKDVLSAFIILVLLFIVGIFSYHRFKLVFWSIFFFFITFSLTSNFIMPIGTIMGERLTYLPSVGFAILVAWIIAEITAKCKAENKITQNKQLAIESSNFSYNRIIGLLMFVVLTTFYSYRTYTRNKDWQNQFALFASAAQVCPKSAKIHTNLGVAYRKIDKIDEAIREYKTALKITPDDAETHSNLGVSYEKKNLLDMAIKEYKKSIELEPNFPHVHNNLGVAYGKKNRIDDAVKEFKIALKNKLNFVEAYNNLGNAYRIKGEFNKAAEVYKKALSIEPDYTAALNNLSAMEKEQGR